MTETEQQPTPPPLNRRRFQYTLRSLFILTTITAVFFSVACSLSYLDAIVALAAFGVLVTALRWPRRVHLATGVFLTLLAATFLWANLRPTRWQREFGMDAPHQLDVVTRGMFWRGWPLSPCMFCLIHGSKFHPEGNPALQGALVVDGALFVASMLAARAVCERCLRKHDK